MNNWTAEKIFNRERFEAWLANQPGERKFWYYSNCRCACASFVRETSTIANPVAGGDSIAISHDDHTEIKMPDWLRVLLAEVPDYFTISHLRTAYQKLFGVDVCAEYAANVPAIESPATA